MSISKFPHHDVAVVGAGLAGLTLALALARSGMHIALIERQSPDQLAAVEVDGRTTALAASARVVLEDIGVWHRLEPYGGPILDIRVTDRASPLHIHFAHAAVGDDPMGHIVENHILRRELLAALAAEPTLTAYWQQSVTAFDGAGDGSGATATLTLDSGTIIQAPLVAAADGRGSALRRMAGIGVRASDYHETRHCLHRLSRALARRHSPHERFLSGGPFAILPMLDNAAGQYRSSIVWTENRSLAEHLLTGPRNLGSSGSWHAVSVIFSGRSLFRGRSGPTHCPSLSQSA